MTSSAVLIWAFSPIKHARLSLDLRVIWVLGSEYTKKKRMNLSGCPELDSAEPGFEDGLNWAP